MKIERKEIGKIIARSFIEAHKWPLFKWLVSGVGFGYFTSLIIPLGQEKWNWSYYSIIIWVLIIAGSIYLVRFFSIAVKEILAYYHNVFKESVYGNAIILLRDSFAEAHHYRKNPSPEEFVKSMMIFCNNLKDSFDGITNSNCSVSIKVPIKEAKVGEHSVLKNLTRDHKNERRDTEKYRSTDHTIIGNSTFSNCLNNVIVNKKNKYYINNDIKNEKNYRNTSIVCYENGKLPYNSELVSPIVPLKQESNENYDCHGFICIDSDKTDAFDEKYAPAILSGVADGIYDIIERLNTEINGI